MSTPKRSSRAWSVISQQTVSWKRYSLTAITRIVLIREDVVYNNYWDCKKKLSPVTVTDHVKILHTCRSHVKLMGFTTTRWQAYIWMPKGIWVTIWSTRASTQLDLRFEGRCMALLALCYMHNPCKNMMLSTAKLIITFQLQNMMALSRSDHNLIMVNGILMIHKFLH